jgi:hypothetical protein
LLLLPQDASQDKNRIDGGGHLISWAKFVNFVKFATCTISLSATTDE